jgi:tRNA(fMet)-specific endonuclease VapC
VGPLQAASEVFVTPIVLGELLYGFRGGGMGADNRRALRELLESSRVSILSLDEETAETYAIIRDYLRKQGTPVPANDLWIAASAVQHGLRLLTLDEHFGKMPQVLLEQLGA